MGDFETLNAALSEFDSPVQAQAEPAESKPPVEEAAPEETTEQQQQPETTQEPEEPAKEIEEEGSPEDVFKSDKQNKAFAEMRVQNKRLNDIVKNLGRIMEVPVDTPPEKLIDMAEARLTELRAQAEKVPVELYKELEETRRRQQETEQESLKQQATLSFQKVKDQYGLTDKNLVEFARQLNENGKNPFTTPMDLVAEYRNLNWEKLLEAERKKADQEYQDRLKKAQTKSTTPSKAIGGSPDVPDKITSMKDFNRLLEGMN